MRAFVTGGCGFVGSNLVDALLEKDYEVIIYDNFSTGKREFIENALKSEKVELIIADLLDKKKLIESMKNIDVVFHLAANADVRFGIDHPQKDLEQNTIATSNVLEAMRMNDVKKIIFSSTGSVYGRAKIFPTPEDYEFPIQTSLYGASKLACEGLIQAYCEAYNIQAFIFRFVSILGERYPHGHIIDFVKKLLENPNELHVLGDGLQKKSYLYVGDCINAIFKLLNCSKEKINIFNLGTDEYISVNDSIKIITNYMNVNPKLLYSGGEQGWIGDNPFIWLDTKKIKSFDWKPELTIQESITKTVKYIMENKWLLKK